MKIQFSVILLFSLSVFGCSQMHTATTDLGDHLYLEYFNINPFGVEEVYLTDSVNFRVYIGKYDAEHEKVRCQVEGDTLVVRKTRVGVGRVQTTIDSSQLSREYLTKNKVDSTKPLFKFR